jgi:hypothetical protein
MVRRNQLSQDALSIRVLHKGKKSENRVDFKSFILNRELTGGIVNDSIFTQFGIESANIKKINATDTLKNYVVESEHFLNLWGDSLKKNGLSLKNSLIINQRNYRENDELYNLYSSFIDSLNTVDKIQFSRLDNEIGYLLKTKRFKFSTALNRGYWRFFTLGSQTRTEWDFRSNMVTQLTDNLEMSLKLNVNLIGANFQRNVDLNMIQRGTNFSHIFNAGWNQLLPNPNQRTYFSNTLDFQIDQPELQKNLFSGCLFLLFLHKVYESTYLQMSILRNFIGFIIKNFPSFFCLYLKNSYRLICRMNKSINLEMNFSSFLPK